MATASLKGFDGKRYAVGDRVVLHPDSAAYIGLAEGTTGVVVGTRSTPADRVHVKLDDDGRTVASYEVSFAKVAKAPKYTVGGGRKRYDTLEAAQEAANRVYRKTGAIVSIEQVSR